MPLTRKNQSTGTLKPDVMESLATLAATQEAVRSLAGWPVVHPQLTPHSFNRHHGVVVATKMHGHYPNPGMAAQALCLFTSAYNYLAKYDIVVFTTQMPKEYELVEIQHAAHPADVKVVQDAPSNISVMINAFPEAKKAALLKWCNASDAENLTWFSHCYKREDSVRLNYGWQAEFRAKHVWTHQALASYETMLWLDTDAFAMSPWHQDPIDMFIRNQLVLLFAHFPQGSSSGEQVQDRVHRAFGARICQVRLLRGQLNATRCENDHRRSIKLVHGFMHVTNLEFFRTEPVRKWTDAWISDNAFSRKFDDQAAVTIPAALLAPDKAWDMWSHGMSLNVMHNGAVDGRYRLQGLPSYLKYWSKYVHAPSTVSTFPRARANCKVHYGN